MFWFFSVQLLKKQTLDPEITLLYQFHGQKALFKVSKICSTNFWIGNSPSPSPLELFSKIIRFGTNIYPSLSSASSISDGIFLTKSLQGWGVFILPEHHRLCLPCDVWLCYRIQHQVLQERKCFAKFLVNVNLACLWEVWKFSSILKCMS